MGFLCLQPLAQLSFEQSVGKGQARGISALVLTLQRAHGSGLDWHQDQTGSCLIWMVCRLGLAFGLGGRAKYQYIYITQWPLWKSFLMKVVVIYAWCQRFEQTLNDNGLFIWLSIWRIQHQGEFSLPHSSGPSKVAESLLLIWIRTVKVGCWMHYMLSFNS